MNEEMKEQLRLAYDLKARDRDQRTISDWRRGPRDDFGALLEREGKVKVLELGSGPGNDGRYFQELGFDILCTDLSPEHIRLCREKGLTAQVLDHTQMSFPPVSFDAVYAMNSLLHLPKADLPAVLGNIQTILKPDGLLFVSFYGGVDSEGPFEDDNHDPPRFFAMYTNEQLKQVLSAFFQIESFQAIQYEGDNPDIVWQTAVLRKSG